MSQGGEGYHKRYHVTERRIEGNFRVRRFFGKPKKTVFFENRNTRCYFWRKTGKPKKPKNRGKTEKNEEKSVFY